MDVLARILAAGGEFASNRAIIVVDGVRVVAAHVVDGKITLTPKGVELLKTTDTKPKKVTAKSKKASADGDD